MPAPAHVVAVFSGVIGTVAAPIEEWSFSLKFPPDAMTGAHDQDGADSLALALRTAFNEIAPDMPSDVNLTQVRVAYVNALGKTAKRADGSYDQGIWTGSKNGDKPAQGMPLQVALCVSLQSERAGATGKGRFFLPWPVLNIDSTTKRITSESLAPFTQNVVDFLNVCEAATGTKAVIASAAAGVLSPVTEVRIGRVPDTMRSRREDVAEGYITLPLA